MPKHCHWLSSNKSLCSSLPGEHINKLKRTNEMSGYVCKRLCYCTMKKSLADIEKIHSDAAWSILTTSWHSHLFSFSLENLARRAASCTSEFVSMVSHKFWLDTSMLWFEKYLWLSIPPLQGTKHCELHSPSFLHPSLLLKHFRVCLQAFMKMRREIVTSRISAAL